MKVKYDIRDDPLTIQLNDCPFEYGHTSLKNTRETNEDAETIVCGHPRETGISLFGVFDGHGGTLSSLFSSQYLHEFFFESLAEGNDIQESLEAAHLKTNQELYHFKSSSGSTSAVGVIDSVHRQIHSGNLGDSRVVLVKRSGRAIQMSRDHSSIYGGTETYSDLMEMQEDIQNIKALGAVLDEGYVMEPTLNNGVNMTRVLGDFYIPGIVENSRPHISTRSYSKGDILIVACDGVWDSTWTVDAHWVVSDIFIEEEIIPKKVRSKLMKHQPITSAERMSIRIGKRPIRSQENATNEIVGYYAMEQRLNGVSAQELSRKIAMKSLNSGDNITVIVVYL
jgi:serine/threonine protein phosphatase PrpC